jgi:hypothetical protein
MHPYTACDWLGLRALHRSTAVGPQPLNDIPHVISPIMVSLCIVRRCICNSHSAASPRLFLGRVGGPRDIFVAGRWISEGAMALMQPLVGQRLGFAFARLGALAVFARGLEG